MQKDIQQRHYRSLSLQVYEAKDLAAIHFSKKTSSPFLTLKSSFNKQHFKTKPQKNTLCPSWENEVFSFINPPIDGRIFVKIWNKNRKKLGIDRFMAGRDFMGECEIVLLDHWDAKEECKWYELEKEPKKKKIGSRNGSVYIKVELIEDESERERTLSETIISQTGAPSEERSHRTPVTISEQKVGDKYELGTILGTGASSVVRAGTRISDGKLFAVKCIQKSQLDEDARKNLDREIELQRKLQHPNIILLEEMLDTKDNIFLVLEHVNGGELFEAIVEKGNYSEHDAKMLAKQTTSAVHYLHSMGVAHRDLKPENLLLSNKGSRGNGPLIIKVGDFGLSKDFSLETLETSCGTPDYIAPEVLLGRPYTQKCDVWGIGVIVYILLCGFPPFGGDDQRQLFFSIMDGRYSFPSPEWDSVSDEAKFWIGRIFHVDPDERATAAELLELPWLKDVPNPAVDAPHRQDYPLLPSFSVVKLKDYARKLKTTPSY